MTISRIQLATIAPHAAPFTLDALYALDADGQPHICRAMTEAGITRPEDVAQFVAVTSLASNGFVNFATADGKHILAQSPVDWLRDKAKDWYDLKMGDESRVWDWDCIVNHLGTRWAINGYDWPDTWDTLDRVCRVLNIENEMEDFLPD